METRSPRAALLRAAPVLHTTNATMKSMRDFFVEKLGFSVDTEVGKGPQFAMLRRDGQTVMLQCTRLVGRRRKGWAIYFWVDDVVELHAELVARGTPLKGEVTDKPYGCREIVALAPDGREIAFGQLLETDDGGAS